MNRKEYTVAWMHTVGMLKRIITRTLRMADSWDYPLSISMPSPFHISRNSRIEFRNSWCLTDRLWNRSPRRIRAAIFAVGIGYCCCCSHRHILGCYCCTTVGALWLVRLSRRERYILLMGLGSQKPLKDAAVPCVPPGIHKTQSRSWTDIYLFY